jgi:tRNA A37 threonylcarbamoyltransferase TsaD
MTIETTAIITGVAIVLVAGAIIAVIKHVSNEKKHPDTEKIVYKDVCNAEMQGLQDCFEAKLNNVVADISEIKTDVKELLKRR